MRVPVAEYPTVNVLHVEVRLYLIVMKQDPDSRYQILPTTIQEAALPAMDAHNPVSTTIVHGDIITHSQRLRIAGATRSITDRATMAGVVMTTVAGTTVAIVLLMKLHQEAAATVRSTTTAVTEPPVPEATAEAEAEINSSF